MPKMIDFILKMSPEDVLEAILLVMLVIAIFMFIEYQFEKRE
ncbi:MAG TPA: hypothetical protein VJ780_11765 [Flavobacterium sp.]|nr:hypothetical protein [Flavobacterium sp.]